MAISNMMRYIGKRELAAWVILTAAFAVMLAFHFSVWIFVVVSVAFVGYVSWTTSSFFVTQGDMRGRAITALALPVCLAILKAVACLGIAWLIVGLARHLFRLESP